MARFDIMPQHNADTIETREFRLNASETFVTGEPVSVNADGELTESADDPVDGDVIGVAAQDGDTAATNGLAASVVRFGQFTDSGIVTTGDLIKVWLTSPRALWESPNYSTAGTAFADTAPAVGDIGERGGLSLISGSWGFDLNVTNFTCRLQDILTADGQSLMYARNGTGARPVFAILASQLYNFGVPDAAVA